MNDWLKAMNPSSVITTENEAQRAARASAISIMIGVVVGLISLAWTFTHPAEIHEAIAAASGGEGGAAVGEAALQMGLWLGGGLVLVQIIFALFQWRNPGKFIAILFLVLLAYGIVSTLAAPLLASSMPNVPNVPIWQVALSIVIMAVQVVLHVAGLRGIKQLDRIQMEQSR